MTTKEFIEKAIDGGWKTKNNDDIKKSEITPEGLRWSYCEYIDKEAILLDPKAWEAVGKIEVWVEPSGCILKDYSHTNCGRCYMHRMIDALCYGKTIEEFLQSLPNQE